MEYLNPPAFPSPETAEFEPEAGMTLRDFFAAHALAGMLANDPDIGRPSEYAQDAYSHADAMLKQR